MGGPISDFPRGSSNSGKDSDESVSESGDDDSAEPDNGTGSPADSEDSAEEPPRSTSKDAGVKAPSGSFADAGTARIDAGAGAATGGQAPTTDSPGDAGTDAGDSLHGPSCTMTSDGREAGGCYGSYCNTMQSSFMKSAEQGGACRSPDELSLACDGEIARVVSQCAERDVVALGVGRSVAACASRAASLAKVGAPCLDCYVDEIVCSLRNCLVSCLDGSSMACSECRASKCGAAFLDCSGLPTPAGGSSLGSRGVDGGLRRF